MNENLKKAFKLARKRKHIIAAFLVFTFCIYYFSNPSPQNYYDYTFRTAENFLRGTLGYTTKPPSWLNEFVPFGGKWYSVFPFGSALSMLPFAALKSYGIVKDMPGAFIAALSASIIGLFLNAIAMRYRIKPGKRILMISGILFGTWMWTNLTFAGAWQIALGFAMIGELGAIYFSVFDRKPFFAGAFFALAFGNRTEILLAAPIFMFLLLRDRKLFGALNTQVFSSEFKKLKDKFFAEPKDFLKPLAKFCVVPFFLGVSTLIYNFVRFGSFTDFGYARIPGVLEEPWYQHGIFSIRYIYGQAYEMLFKSWEFKDAFPFFVPDGFSSSILLSSPFLFLVFRFGARDKILKYAAWTAIFVLTFLLWTHGNSGGWQFGYRYAMILLPWIFLILLENSPRKITLLEWIFYAFSIFANLYATYLFHWTDYLKP
jgi:hypothetical protein